MSKVAMELLVVVGGGRWLLVLCALVVASTSAQVLRDTKKYPACLVDEDCLEYHKLADHVCYQYFCYPHKKATEALEASQAGAFKDLPPCSRRRPCASSQSGPGKERQVCRRHHDKRRVSVGVCVGERSNKECSSHSDCAGDAGGFCCNEYCCGQEYFDALKRLPCSNDIGCQVRNNKLLTVV